MILALILVIGCLIALASGKVPGVLAFIVTLTLAGLLGVAPSAELLSGFSSTGVITVAAMLVVARGVVKTGVVSRVTFRVLAGVTTARSALARLLGPLGIASAFINNTPIVAMSIPAARELEQRVGLSARRIYMPVAFAAAIGGTLTLIGTSSNLLIASLAGDEGVDITMFSFLPVALPAFIAAVGALVLLAPSLIRAGRTDTANDMPFRVELALSPAALIVGDTLDDYGLRSTSEFTADAILRGGGQVGIDSPLEAGDIVSYRATRRGVASLWSSPRFGNPDQRLYGVTLGPSAHGPVIEVGGDDESITIIGARTGSALADTSAEPGLPVLATASDAKALDGLDDVAMVADASGRAPQPGRTILALTILAAVVGVAGAGLVPVEWAASAGALAMVFTGILTPRAAVRALDWNLLAILAGSVGLGAIVTYSGLAAKIADGVSGLGSASTLALAITVALVAMVMAGAVTTAASVTILTPVVIDVASSLDVSAIPLLALVGTAACLSYANPFSNQSFILVMGPGRYSFGEFVRLGLPVSVVALALAVTGAMAWLWVLG